VTSVKVDTKTAIKQGQLSEKIDISILDALIKNSEQRQCALIFAQQTSHASAWKHATVKASQNHCLRPDEFQVS
jgi:hypothetical protein